MNHIFWDALSSQNWTLAKHCLDEGDLIVSNDSGPLHLAIMSFDNRPDIIEWLILQGADLGRRNADNFTPLIAAAQCGYTDAVSVLLRSGADVNSSTLIDENWTPLMAAAVTGHRAIVKMLLVEHADVSRQDRWGRDAATLAELKGYLDIAQLIRDGKR